MERAAICATPGSASDCIMGYLGEDYFCVEPLNPERKCTPTSVSAHTLYEKSNPYILPGRIATAGNLAFPFSPSDIKVGETYVFSVYALLRTEDPLTLSTPVYEEVTP